MINYWDVSSSGAYNPVANIGYSSDQIEVKINDINKQLKSGFKLILMIDSDLIDDLWDYDELDLHWIVLESEISKRSMLDDKGKAQEMLDFKVYSWGTNPNNEIPLVFDKDSGKMIDNKEYRYLKRPISKTNFMNNFNGYIKVK